MEAEVEHLLLVTRIEHRDACVLECLLAAHGRVVSAEELLERVWDEAADPFTTTVKATMNRGQKPSAMACLTIEKRPVIRACEAMNAAIAEMTRSASRIAESTPACPVLGVRA